MLCTGDPSLAVVRSKTLHRGLLVVEKRQTLLLLDYTPCLKCQPPPGGHPAKNLYPQKIVLIEHVAV